MKYIKDLFELQERLQERIRVESELREEKNKLLNVIKEKEGEVTKERSELTQRLQQHEQVIEVRASSSFIRELTKRRRRWQRRRYKTIGLVSKSNGSARSARAFYILVHFFAVIS